MIELKQILIKCNSVKNKHYNRCCCYTMLCAVNFRNMNEKIKRKLKVNGCEHLIKPLEKVRPSGANQMAGGIQFVYDNWDVAPNGGILTDIIEYLKSKANS